MATKKPETACDACGGPMTAATAREKRVQELKKRRDALEAELTEVLTELISLGVDL